MTATATATAPTFVNTMSAGDTMPILDTMTNEARWCMEDLRTVLYDYYDVWAQTTPTHMTLILGGAEDYPASRRAAQVCATLTGKGFVAVAEGDRITITLGPKTTAPR